MRNKDGNQIVIGNEFSFRRAPVMQPALETAALVPIPRISPMALPAAAPKASTTIRPTRSNKRPRLGAMLDIIHDNSVIVFALLFLLIGVASIELGSRYIIAHDYPAEASSYSLKVSTLGGLNKAVGTSQMSTFINNLTNQTATLNLGSQTINISPSTIKSWLTTTSSSNASEDNIHIDASVIEDSLTALVNKYVSAPVDQVTVTRSDGSSEVAIAGQNGSKLSDSADLSGQAITLAKNLFSDKGFNINAPLITVPYASVTPSAFSKLIVVDLNSKEMYLYQSGQLINTFPVSAGKPSTPTPVGEFHIWDKSTSQTMTGPGYVQPDVPWINYFDHRGDAIHGVYWRPASVFGNINTSHGCVGVPVSTAEYIFNWAPIGTTIITTSN